MVNGANRKSSMPMVEKIHFRPSTTCKIQKCKRNGIPKAPAGSFPILLALSCFSYLVIFGKRDFIFSIFSKLKIRLFSEVTLETFKIKFDFLL